MQTLAGGFSFKCFHLSNEEKLLFPLFGTFCMAGPELGTLAVLK
jgi:hypothetical protein